MSKSRYKKPYFVDGVKIKCKFKWPKTKNGVMATACNPWMANLICNELNLLHDIMESGAIGWISAESDD